jgi:hypothetical protein
MLGIFHRLSLGSRVLVLRLTRTSLTPPELDTVIQRSGAFASTVADVTGRHERITLLTARTDRESVSYIITPGQGGNSRVVASIASALGAKAVPVEGVHEITGALDSPSTSFLVARPRKRASFAAQPDMSVAVMHATADGNLHLSTTVPMGYWNDANELTRNQGYVGAL